VAGAVGVSQYVRAIKAHKPRLPQHFWLNVLLPIAAVVLFGALFIRANPDVVKLVGERWNRSVEWLIQRMEEIGEHWGEFLFCVGAAYLAIGLLRPVLGQTFTRRGPGQAPMDATATRASPFYYALRNTLIALIALFALYLVF